MIRVGLVGLGFMGWIHWLAYQMLRGVLVTAVCDRKPKRLLGDWRGLRGNFGPPGRRINLKGASTHSDWRELIHDEAVDLVDITLPTALHAEVAIEALGAGKHVLCEKPMALSSRDCRRMIQAAKKAGRMLMIGHVLPFFPEYAWLLKITRSGKYGSACHVWLKREISEPTWTENYWSAAHVGGPMFDLHIHDAHFARLLFGRPTSVTATGSLRDGVPEAWSWRLRFSDRLLSVHGQCGVRNGCGWTFNHGFDASLQKAGLRFDFLVSGGKGRYMQPPVIDDFRGQSVRNRYLAIGAGDPFDAFIAELRSAIGALRSGEVPKVLSPILACDAVRICEAETKSLHSGRAMRV
jgi:predicted dehydrogenase